MYKLASLRIYLKSLQGNLACDNGYISKYLAPNACDNARFRTLAPKI